MKVALRAGLVAAGLWSTSAVAMADPHSTAGFTAGDISQHSTNHADVLNGGAILGNGHVGTGASASVSATGAVASVSGSNIETKGPKIDVTVERIRQDAKNGGANVTNDGGTIDMTAGGSKGTLKGAGASASISAAGAVANVSVANINSSGVNIKTGDIRQHATNEGGTVSNQNESITVGSIRGAGASASINASGAVASISVSNINSPMGSVKIGDISQHATNKGYSTVTNSGTITLGSLSGAGASASISAVGSAAVVSFSNIGSGPRH